MNEIINKLIYLGYGSRQAVIAARVNRGIDDLDQLCEAGDILKTGDYKIIKEAISMIAELGGDPNLNVTSVVPS
jgi:hypothetical protein